MGGQNNIIIALHSGHFLKLRNISDSMLNNIEYENIV
jgi:hypothetical protein